MSISSFQKKEENINAKNIQSKPIFNSKLFLYLDINQETPDDSNNENNLKEDYDLTQEFEQKNYLSNELIKDLDGSISSDDINDRFNNENKDENETKKNIINSLISLAKDGYEFKPKNYKPKKDYIKKEKIIKNDNYIDNKFSKNKFNKRRDNKKDWICPFCNNLNFSFRTICNKCKISKVNPDLSINNNLCVL